MLDAAGSAFCSCQQQVQCSSDSSNCSVVCSGDESCQNEVQCEARAGNCDIDCTGDDSCLDGTVCDADREGNDCNLDAD